MRCELRRDLAPAAEARQRERDGRVPAPARGEHRRVEQRLHEQRPHGLGVAGSARPPRAGSCGWSPSESTIASSVAAACSSKLNLRQKRLRSARPHARLMRLPNGACMTSCMPPDSSKKRSSTSVRCVGSAPSAARAAARYSTICSAAAWPTPTSRTSHSIAAAAPPRSRAASIASRSRDTAPDSSSAARRRLAEPERNARRRALRVLDPHRAALDAQDALRRVAELEDVAGQALDREVLVDRADHLRLRARARPCSRRCPESRRRR